MEIKTVKWHTEEISLGFYKGQVCIGGLWYYVYLNGSRYEVAREKARNQPLVVIGTGVGNWGNAKVIIKQDFQEFFTSYYQKSI